MSFGDWWRDIEADPWTSVRAAAGATAAWGAVAGGPALVLWPMVRRLDPDFITANDLSISERAVYFGVVVGWVGLATLAVAAVARRAGVGFLPAIRRATGRAWWCAAAPLLLPVIDLGAERDAPFLVLLAIAGLAGTVGAWVYHQGGAPPRRGPLVDGAAAAAVGIAAVAYTLRVGGLALQRHWALHTNIFDLSIYNNLMWRTLHGEWLACTFCRGDTHLSAHFDPLLVALTPLYALAPRPETLLVFQTVWLASTVIPLHLLGARRLGHPGYGVATAVAFLAAPGLHGVNLFDFHSLALLVPTFVWAVYLLDTGRVWGFALAVAVLLATREDVSLLVVVLGLWAFVEGRTRVGIATGAAAVAWLLFVKTQVLGSSAMLGAESSESYSYTSRFAAMLPHAEEGALGFVITAVTNPTFVASVVLTQKKLMYVALTFGPVGGLPLLAGRRALLLGYAVAFVGLTSSSAVASVQYQYTALLLPALFVALPDGVAAAAELLARHGGLEATRLRPALAAGVVAASVLVGAKFGGFVENQSFKAAGQALAWRLDPAEAERYACLERLRANIPDDAPVVATTDVVAHVSGRVRIEAWPKAHGAAYKLVWLAELSEEQRAREREDGRWRLIGSCSDLRLFRAR